MEKIVISQEYFNVKDTLSCGQVFRYSEYKNGYKIISKDKCAYCYNQNGFAVIECEKKDVDYFKHYFDTEKDYSLIYFEALKQGGIIEKSASLGKGIRILNQDIEETLFSFMVSQNNNIPRIKSTIEKICVGLGEKRIFDGEEYYTFPSIKKMATAPLEFYKSIGLGYRAEYIKGLAERINDGYDVVSIKDLGLSELKKELLSIKGVGEKVCDCVLFFGYGKTESFPVDTWIEKVYREDFNGKLTDRKKIAEYFTKRFNKNSGYIQQYLFHYKRNVEK